MLSHLEYHNIKLAISTGSYNVDIWKVFFEHVIKRSVTDEEVHDTLYKINKERMIER